MHVELSVPWDWIMTVLRVTHSVPTSLLLAVLQAFVWLCRECVGAPRHVATDRFDHWRFQHPVPVASVWINLVLCVFNFLPIPPLDGSRILTGLLPAKLADTYASYEKYGFILVLVLAFTGVLSMIISPIIRFANTLLL